MKTDSKVLIVTRNLPPLLGGMEKLNWQMAAHLQQHYSVRIVGPSKSSALRPKDTQYSRVSLKPLWWFLSIAAIKSVFRAWTSKPAHVLAGSGLTAPIALVAAKTCNAQSIAYVHGLDVAVNNTLYKKLWHPALRKVDIIIANSTPTATLCMEIGINPEKISIIHPGTTLPAPRANFNEKVSLFINNHDLENCHILVSVGRLTERKGLKEFVQYSMPIICSKIPNIKLLIVGEAPQQSLLNSSQSKESILAAAAERGIESKLLFIGPVTDTDRLSTIYYASDVHVFPVRTIPGDPEGFGMVAIEAAAHGLQTVAFATGGVTDAVREGTSGSLIKPEDYISFAEEVILKLRAPKKLEATCIDFGKEFCWDNFGASLDSVIQRGQIKGS